MGQGRFNINGTAIKNPSTFRIERFNVTTLERLADGDITGDFIAKKRKFYFTYDAIVADELNEILDVIWETEELFYELDYEEGGTSKSATVYVGSIPTELHYGGSDSGSWVWKNVTFNLIER